ncbi:Glyoxylase, beta-lactamase superfamily II [Humidesulfovibrio mexicanus]|uniref:Glyoxylase, beta-lactamase superfamily II n=1 Tax=Humidesulfovibrio mexicanus TaxID=147047 RepID=A0A238Y7R1_9BACT|nr:MBL fold metallo-hydrolase [Humidesulfovibrio mexicanus]SNR67316.1 Glyoxylase, beta-lactamase superfamily II [Humidesulfovibrio mexicanus]
MRITSFPLGPLETNCHILDHQGRALVVDPGGDPAEALVFLRSEGLSVEHILVTHLHFDHIYGCASLAEATGAPVLAPAADAYLMDTELGQGGVFGFPVVTPFASQPVPLGQSRYIGLECRCLATPGHTPGSVTYYFPQAKAAFVGDLIFYRSVGRTDFPGGSAEALKRSVLEQIFTLPDDTALYPGHGLDTTVAAERTHNPFFLHDMF